MVHKVGPKTHLLDLKCVSPIGIIASRSTYMLFSCIVTTLASSSPYFGAGFYDIGFHISSCGLCRLSQDVPKSKMN